MGLTTLTSKIISLCTKNEKDCVTKLKESSLNPLMHLKGNRDNSSSSDSDSDSDSDGVSAFQSKRGSKMGQHQRDSDLRVSSNIGMGNLRKSAMNGMNPLTISMNLTEGPSNGACNGN